MRDGAGRRRPAERGRPGRLPGRERGEPPGSGHLPPVLRLPLKYGSNALQLPSNFILINGRARRG